MHFPRFWNVAQTGRVRTWGWSDVSAADALRVAHERQERVFAWLRAGGKRKHELGDYGYPNRPMREEVLREIRGEGDGELAAVITRNSAGSLVLNTRGLVFVDVDTPETVGGFVDWLLRRRLPDPQTFTEERVRATAEQWVAQHPDWRWRLYRTAAGVRLMATQGERLPEDPLVQQAFEAFGADRRYRLLCKHQRCFRARLTPKAWRCDVHKPPRWPWENAQAEADFRAWDREYLNRSLNFATCRFLGEIGTAPAAQAVAPLIALHDEGTQATADLPLA